jgi:secreted trypsin-like serine protease
VKYAQIGRYDLSDSREDFEQFEILQPEYVHPQYNKEEFPHDFMLLKLAGQSRKQYILANVDNTLPSTDGDDIMTVMGFGATEAGNPNSEPLVLQEVQVTYVPNNVCEEAKDPQVPDDYQGLIESDMLCAMESGKDACQGDSGGPLVIARGDAAQDVLVGIVSW